MFAQILAIHREWLRHPIHGVNALLPAVPTAAILPATPSVALITDEATDPAVAIGELPRTLPVLAWTMEPWQPQPADQAQDVGDGFCGLALRYGVSETNAAHATRWAGDTLRAATWSLRRFYYGSAPEVLAARQDAEQTFGLQVITAGTMLVQPAFQAKEGALITGLLSIQRLQYRDLAFTA